MAYSKVICNKHDVVLGMIKNEDNDEELSFKLEFDLYNDKIDLHNVVGFKLYELINAVNRKI